MMDVGDTLTPWQIKETRRELGLTQKQCGEIFGGGPNAFSRYERGETTPLRSTIHLLQFFKKYPEELDSLALRLGLHLEANRNPRPVPMNMDNVWIVTDFNNEEK